MDWRNIHVSQLKIFIVIIFQPHSLSFLLVVKWCNFLDITKKLIPEEKTDYFLSFFLMWIIPEGSSVAIIVLCSVGFAFVDYPPDTFSTLAQFTQNWFRVCTRYTTFIEVLCYKIKKKRQKWTWGDSASCALLNNQILSWLTEITLFDLLMEETHGNVPACCTSQTSVTWLPAYQCLPGHSGVHMHYSHSIIGRGICWNEYEITPIGRQLIQKHAV